SRIDIAAPTGRHVIATGNAPGYHMVPRWGSGRKIREDAASRPLDYLSITDACRVRQDGFCAGDLLPDVAYFFLHHLDGFRSGEPDLKWRLDCLSVLYSEAKRLFALHRDSGCRQRPNIAPLQGDLRERVHPVMENVVGVFQIDLRAK